MKIVSRKTNESGFTIIELIIATTVFGTMLLLASAGIIQIGKIYYKGITVTRTQETARAIVGDISKNYQISSSKAYATSAVPGPNGERAICFGVTRYTYLIGQIVTADRHGLWTDRITYGEPCTAPNLNTATPSDSSTDVTPLGENSRRELLAQNMRLSQFDIQPPVNGTLEIRAVRIIYAPEMDLTTGAVGSEECVTAEDGGQFCAAVALNSFVKARLP